MLRLHIILPKSPSKKYLAESKNNTDEYVLRCNCYKVSQLDKSKFKPGTFSKIGVKEETIKQQRSKGEIKMADRMPSAKLKRTNNNTRTTADRRPNNDKKTSADIKRKTSTKRARTRATRCHMNIKLAMLRKTGQWFIRSSSNLTHKNHAPETAESHQLEEHDLSPDDLSWVEEMYESGLSNGTIAGILTAVFEKKGKSGGFLPSTIRNITSKIKKESKVLSGITEDFSLAEKTIARLNK